MANLKELIADGYGLGAPSLEAQATDSAVARRRRCRQCGGRMHYEGYHRHHDNACTEYVALAGCDRCGHEIEFQARLDTEGGNRVQEDPRKRKTASGSWLF